MVRIKRFCLVFLFVILSISLFGCKKESSDALVLRIYNWEDYIDEGLDDDGEKVGTSVMEDWAEDYYNRTGKKVEVIYNTFETNEYMLNVLKTGSEHYDLVCPSDYFIQKMISENMLEKLDYNDEEGYKYITNFNDYGSPYIKNIFNSHETKNKETEEELNWSYYAIPYMWGTIGFTYRMDEVETEDVQTWNILWNNKYAKRSTAKNSIHDTYVAGVMYVYQDELNDLKDKYENDLITLEEYNTRIDEIMNDFSDETLEKVEKALIEMKDNFYGFEVDNGKTDILGGTIAINLAWSGDAVYSMDTAEESDVYLGFEVPLEGSNVFFDGWVMPKGANTELAQDFLNFLCLPATASRNMEYIGYTSVVAGDEIWELINDWYSAEDDEEYDEVDLSYFFEGTISEDYLTDGKAIIYVSSENRGRQFDAQYPSPETLSRCAIMKDFGEQNDAVIILWENVKCGEIGGWLWAGLGMLITVISLFVYYEIYLYKKKNRHKKN